MTRAGQSVPELTVFTPPERPAVKRKLTWEQGLRQDGALLVMVAPVIS